MALRLRRLWGRAGRAASYERLGASPRMRTGEVAPMPVASSPAPMPSAKSSTALLAVHSHCAGGPGAGHASAGRQTPAARPRAPRSPPPPSPPTAAGGVHAPRHRRQHDRPCEFQLLLPTRTSTMPKPTGPTTDPRSAPTAPLSPHKRQAVTVTGPRFRAQAGPEALRLPAEGLPRARAAACPRGSGCALLAFGSG